MIRTGIKKLIVNEEIKPCRKLSSHKLTKQSFHGNKTKHNKHEICHERGFHNIRNFPLC